MKLGDKVRLNSGGPPMTVVAELAGGALCEWFNTDHELRTEQFRLDALSQVTGEWTLSETIAYWEQAGCCVHAPTLAWLRKFRAYLDTRFNLTQESQHIGVEVFLQIAELKYQQERIATWLEKMGDNWPDTPSELAARIRAGEWNT